MNGDTKADSNGDTLGESDYDGYRHQYTQQHSKADLLTFTVDTKPDGKSIRKERSKRALIISLICVVVVVSLAIAGAVTTAILLTRNPDGDDARNVSQTTSTDPPAYDGVTGVCRTPGCITLANLLQSNLDETVDPCDHFYNFSCGGWLGRTSLPAGSQIYTQSESYVQNNTQQLRNILERDNISETDNVEAVAKVKAFYRLCMDTQTINATGVNPLLALIEQTGGWNLINGGVSEQWDINSRYFIKEKLYRSRALFRVYVDVDDKNSSQHIIKITQGDLGLLRAARRRGFKSYFGQVMLLLNSTVPRKMYMEAADEMIDFNKKLIAISASRENLRDVNAKYNKMTLGDLSSLWPDFDWVESLQYLFSLHNVSVHENETVIVETPTYFENLSTIFRNTSTETLENYAKWHLVSFFIQYLSDPFVDAFYDFRGGAVPDRFSTCLELAQRAFPIAIARQYIEEIYPNNSKARTSVMVNRIIQAFRKRLEEVRWLDDSTKILVLEKIKNVGKKVAHPDQLFNDTYLNSLSSDIAIFENNYMGTVAEARRAQISRGLSKLHQAVERKMWTESPLDVNAFYNPSSNELTIPAAFTLPPNMGGDWPDYYNFGALGTIIGHELTHALDDQGQQYDPNGNFRQWWSSTAVGKFREEQLCIRNQYSKYEFYGGRINPDLTLGENIADNGGLMTSYQAYKSLVAEKREPQLVLPGLRYTPEQIFFIAQAQTLCAHYLDAFEFIPSFLMNSPHSPAPYRVIGPLSNSEEFSRTFNCPQNAPMNPPDKCVIW